MIPNRNIFFLFLNHSVDIILGVENTGECLLQLTGVTTPFQILRLPFFQPNQPEIHGNADTIKEAVVDYQTVLAFILFVQVYCNVACGVNIFHFITPGMCSKASYVAPDL